MIMMKFSESSHMHIDDIMMQLIAMETSQLKLGLILSIQKVLSTSRLIDLLYY